MPPVPEHEVLLVGGDELVARVVRGSAAPAAAQVVVAQAVEGVAVGPQGRVAVDGVGGDFEDDAGGDVLAVGEGDAFVYFAREGGWRGFC